MSGTSLDGLDMAICEFQLDSGNWSYSILHAETLIYPTELSQRLKKAYSSTASELAKLNSDFGRFIGTLANQLINKTKIKVDLIASHGHTIFHEPEKGYTLQIGNGAEIAAQTGITTVCDFRSMDVANGGQGAPLVPIGDELLFSEFDACINLGGFANISYRNNKGNRIAFDICPVNFVLNRQAQKLGHEYDKGGAIAESGTIIPKLLNDLNNNEYYLKEPPKSLGQEWVEREVLPLMSGYNANDLLTTFIEHVSIQIANCLKKLNGQKVLLTGGGVFNEYLMRRLEEKTTKSLIIPEKEIIEMKEAVIFAFLGVLRMREEVNCLASCTGAKQDSLGGVVHMPHEKHQTTNKMK